MKKETIENCIRLFLNSRAPDFEGATHMLKYLGPAESHSFLEKMKSKAVKKGCLTLALNLAKMDGGAIAVTIDDFHHIIKANLKNSGSPAVAIEAAQLIPKQELKNRALENVFEDLNRRSKYDLHLRQVAVLAAMALSKAY